MMNNEIKQQMLDVRNLRISFRTNNGTVKAVRGINFELYKGETLAIVGESGSGKSVTSRAILGIQAPNKIVEGGEIIYDGKDLLKISEDDFHDIRGSKISMIFQDPMSSLDPIMKIGKQLTEAMLLKGKASQREAKKQFNHRIALLQQALAKSVEGLANQKEEEKAGKDAVLMFEKITYLSAAKEKQYNIASENAKEALAQIKNLLESIVHISAKEMNKCIYEINKKLIHTPNEYLVDTDYISLKMSTLTSEVDKEALKTCLEDLQDTLTKAIHKVRPDFFAMGYFSFFGNLASLQGKSQEEQNFIMRSYLNEKFLNDFSARIKKALILVYQDKDRKRKKALDLLQRSVSTFEKPNITKQELVDLNNKVNVAVRSSINKMVLVKDSLAYTYQSSMSGAIDMYYHAVNNNPKETKRYEDEMKQYNEKVKNGKTAIKPIPPTIIDLDLARQQIDLINQRLIHDFEEEEKAALSRDYDKTVLDLLRYLEKQASLMVYRVTKDMAKEKAIELMSEVGIPEPRRRFYQYPFEFSGGMRQRIVIAIALAANPDILICDEPTTALDVTIQAQILELINRLKRERQLSIIFITHNLGVVANMADRIAVMYAGKIVEYGSVDEIFYQPKHPYTWALLSSMPDLETKEKLDAIPGTPPNMIFPPKGDAFAARNKYAMAIDFEKEPPLFEVSPTHFAATWLLHPDAPKVEPPKIVTERINRMRQIERGDSDGK